MELEQKYQIKSLQNCTCIGKIKHIFSTKFHNDLFDKPKYCIIISNDGEYLMTTVAGIQTYQRIWNLNFQKSIFQMDQTKYKFILE